MANRGLAICILQGVNKSHAKLVRERTPFDVTLFTILPDKRRRYVAHIEEVECLDEIQAKEALEVFERNGWLSTMKSEISAIGGNVDALGHAEWAKHVLNVRFRHKNVQFFPDRTFASDTDKVQKLNRYVLADASHLDFPFSQLIRRVGSLDLPDVAREVQVRQGFGPVEVSPEYARMQRELMIELRKEYPNGSVEREFNFIDVLVRTADEMRLYEIKSDLSPRSVLRQAIGQLLEYSFFYIKSDGRKKVLTVVGRSSLSDADAEYLKHLCEEFKLPLEYRVMSI
ncbi:hypothetical protein LXM60_03735 [Pandoraea sputorum]|uniref:hypothetical protein n=1 Tax=Pandoraea sputorum TaxID=93222 RepID=UPI001E4979DE|nr:hypothetical protein [Pandoraea sputorum]MCE4059318.1 hypothetical protein [Pandoraea sputorum]